MKLTTERIDNYAIEVHVNGAGKFTGEVDGEDFTANTLDELREQLRRAVKKLSTQRAVPVTILGMHTTGKRYEPVETAIGFIHAKLRGKHERNDEWLLTADTGEKFSLRQWSGGTKISRRLNDAETSTYVRLATAVKDAERKLEEFVKSVTIEPQRALADARKGASKE